MNFFSALKRRYGRVFGHAVGDQPEGLPRGVTTHHSGGGEVSIHLHGKSIGSVFGNQWAPGYGGEWRRANSHLGAIKALVRHARIRGGAR